MSRATETRCPCDQGRSYADCCQRFHQGAEPTLPRELVAARYAAFVLGDAVFLHRTLHAQHDDHAGGVAAMRQGLDAQRRRVRYQRLQLLDSRGPDASGAAEVLFHVGVRVAGRDQSFVERSYFLHDGAGWRYLAGDTRATRDLPASPAALTLDAFDRLPR